MKFIKNYFGANAIKYISIRIIVIPHHAYLIFSNIYIYIYITKYQIYIYIYIKLLLVYLPNAYISVRYFGWVG